jgi:Xaa-Pro dipeptidase
MNKELHVNRIKRAQALMQLNNIDLLFLEPCTSMFYFSGVKFDLSERLTALIIPQEDNPFILCPAFEEERVRKSTKIGEVSVWGETDNPFDVLSDTFSEINITSGVMAIEPNVRYFVSAQLKKKFRNFSFTNGSIISDEARMIKTEIELQFIRAATKLTDEKITEAIKDIKAGITELELCKKIGDALVQFGENTAIPHANASERKLKEGDVIIIDASHSHKGFLSDLTRMFYFGKPTDEMYKIHSIVHGAQSAAIDTIKAGMTCESIDKAARSIIEKAGYGEYFIHRVGHSLGMDVHEPPYLVSGNKRRLESGMVFTIEPGIYLPNKFGIRLEDDVVVTDDGCELLSTRVKEMKIIELR